MSNKQVGFFNGNLGIGTKHPQSSVHIDRNDAMILPKGTTSQRPVQQLTDGMIHIIVRIIMWKLIHKKMG